MQKVISNLSAESEILSSAIVKRKAADRLRFNANYLRLINQPLVVGKSEWIFLSIFIIYAPFVALKMSSARQPIQLTVGEGKFIFQAFWTKDDVLGQNFFGLNWK